MNNMTNLQSLTTFLHKNLPSAATEFSYKVKEMTFLGAHRKLGMSDAKNSQYQILTQQYEAVITWEHWPYRQVDTCYIPVLIEAWYQNLEDDFIQSGFDYKPSLLEINTLNDTDAIVIATVKMQDAIILKEDENGIVPFDEKRWSLAFPQVLFAENIDVIIDKVI